MTLKPLSTTYLECSRNYFADESKHRRPVRLTAKLQTGRFSKKELTDTDQQREEDKYAETILKKAKYAARHQATLSDLHDTEQEELEGKILLNTYQFLLNTTYDHESLYHPEEFGFNSLIKMASKGAMRDLMAEDIGIPVNASRNLALIKKAISEISMEKEKNCNQVTPEEVREKLSDKHISLDTIERLVKLSHGNVYWDSDEVDYDWMESKIAEINGCWDMIDELVERGAFDVSAGNFDGLSTDTREKLDATFSKLSDLEIFLVMKEAGFLGEKMRRATAKQLSYQDFFIELAMKDKDGKKHIEYGDVSVIRPGREGCINEKIDRHSVNYVKEKFYTNKIAKIKLRLRRLSEELDDVSELRGWLEPYCYEVWQNRGLDSIQMTMN